MDNSLTYELFTLLPENASHSEIENAYKALALAYHPDKHPRRTAWANEKMKQLNEAKALLLDPSKRTAFLQGLKNKEVHEMNRLNEIKRLKNENQSLIQAVQKKDQATGIMAILLLLLGGALIDGEKDHKSNKNRRC